MRLLSLWVAVFAIVQFKPSESLASQWLPTELDWPDTDNRPVDNKLQMLLPILLRTILELVWSNRFDWFFGANRGVYYDPQRPAVRPDEFLSLGVPHYRPAQALWRATCFGKSA